MYCYEVAKTLREYADIIDNQQGGNDRVETYFSPRGTKLTTMTATCFGHEIPHEPYCFPPLVSEQKEK